MDGRSFYLNPPLPTPTPQCYLIGLQSNLKEMFAKGETLMFAPLGGGAKGSAYLYHQG